MIRSLFLVIFSCACFISQAQVNIITTIAGKDTFGYSGDGGPATNAKLKAPVFICEYSNHIYISDALNHCIRDLDVTTGGISTVAGNGIGGYSGDGLGAIYAQFEVPQGISSDTNGNIYVGDALNYRIRKITKSTGMISSVAGNGNQGISGDNSLATNAELDGIVGVNVDVYGNVYCVDWTNNRVRKIEFSTGIITTIAGTGVTGSLGDGGLAVNAQINRPSQVFVTLSGNILIAEQYGHVVRQIDATSGIINTIVGNGISGFSGDGGLAVNAKLNQPTGLFVDKQNNIYIAEYGNGTIRKIDAVTGIITTVAGTGVTGFSGDGGPATNAKLFCSDVFVDNNGNLIIADYENNRIRKVSSGVLVNGIDKEIEGKLYPNPTKGAFTIQTPMNIAIVSIYNIAGMRVYEQTCTTPQTEVDITNQPPGIYMVYVQCGEKQYVSKIVKQ